MSSCLQTTLLTLLLCWYLTDPIVGFPAPSGVIRRGARIPSGSGHRRGELLSGKDFLSVFIENQANKEVTGSMDQSAEPSSMIGEVAKIAVRLGSYQNKVSDQGGFLRKPSLDLDDPVFGSRQSPKYRFRFPFSQSGSEKERNDIYSDTSLRQQNGSDSRLESNPQPTPILNSKPLYGSDFKNYFVAEVQSGPEFVSEPPLSVTQSVIAVGESRSYSTSTNTQSPLTKEVEDNSISQALLSGTTSTSSVEPSSTTVIPEETSTSDESLTTILHSAGDRVQGQSFSWSTGTRWNAKANDEEEKIISVKVTSSVARLPAQYSSIKANLQQESTTDHVDDYTTTPSLTLLTEDQPRVTAIQRSQFSVEESLPEATSSDTFNPQVAPVSYQSAVSSATSDSRVQFYSDPPSYHRRGNLNIVSQSPLGKATAELVTENTSANPPDTKLEVVGEDLPSSEQYKHETRIERVSYHQEVVSNQPQGEDTFGKRLQDGSSLPYVAQTEATTEVNSARNDQRSYQFTNVHDQSFHHVQVTHHSPDSKVADAIGSTKENRFVNSGRSFGMPERVYGVPEQNYEVDESVSLMTNGRAHGVQSQLTTEASQSKMDSNKFGYVVEGRNFRKYRVEERTSDGFIVGEYGVVRHDDGSLRGVRYTADSTINPRVIYDALLKFLSL